MIAPHFLNAQVNGRTQTWAQTSTTQIYNANGTFSFYDRNRLWFNNRALCSMQQYHHFSLSLNNAAIYTHTYSFHIQKKIKTHLLSILCFSHCFSSIHSIPFVEYRFAIQIYIWAISFQPTSAGYSPLICSTAFRCNNIELALRTISELYAMLVLLLAVCARQQLRICRCACVCAPMHTNISYPY